MAPASRSLASSLSVPVISAAAPGTCAGAAEDLRRGGLRLLPVAADGLGSGLLLEDLPLEPLHVAHAREAVRARLARRRHDPDVPEAEHPTEPGDDRPHVGDGREEGVGRPTAKQSIGPEHAQVGHVVLRGPPGDDVVDDPSEPAEEEGQPQQLQDPIHEPGDAGRGVALEPGRGNRADHHQDRPLRVAERRDPMLRRRPNDRFARDQPWVDIRHVRALAVFDRRIVPRAAAHGRWPVAWLPGYNRRQAAEHTGESPSGKAPDSGSGDRRFESFLPATPTRVRLSPGRCGRPTVQRRCRRARRGRTPAT